MRLSIHQVQRTGSPTGFLSPIILAADSLIISPEESPARARSKSRPSTNCQPAVLPCVCDTASVAKLSSMLGLRPFQSHPLFPEDTSVTGPMDSDTSTTEPVFLSSFRNTSYFPLKSLDFFRIIINPSRS